MSTGATMRQVPPATTAEWQRDGADGHALLAESFSPPLKVQSAARRGLRLRQRFGFGGTAVGVARARDLSNGRGVSLDTIGRMVSFFARHGAQKPANVGTDSQPTPWLIAWLLWGGDAGREWAESVWRRQGPDAAMEDLMLRETTTWVAMREPLEYREPMFSVPDGLKVGRPIRVLSCGAVRSRVSGEEIQTLSRDALEDMARLVVERSAEDPVVIDFGHASSPMLSDSTDSAKAVSLGLVVGAYVEDEDDGRGPGLYVIPAYNERGLEVIRNNAGVLWSSPEFYPGDVYARSGDEKVRIGGAQLLALALTNRPAQEASAVDRVVLSEGGIPAPDTEEACMADDGTKQETMMEPEGMSPDEMASALKAKDEEIKGLRAYISELEERVAESGEMSESSPDAAALSEAAALTDDLRKKVKKLSEDLAIERGKRERAEDEALATSWVGDGRIAPAERDAFIAALTERRFGRSAFYEFTFAKRTAGSAVPMGESGHAVKKDDVDSKVEADRIVRAYAEREKVDYRDAYKHLTANDPEFRALMKGN